MRNSKSNMNSNSMMDPNKPLDSVQHIDHIEPVDSRDLAMVDEEKGDNELTERAMVLDPEEDKRVRRKIDLMIMPILCFIYALNFVSQSQSHWRTETIDQLLTTNAS
jgi:hypothetical protein